MNDTVRQISNLSAEEKRALLAQLLKEKAKASTSVYPLSYNQQAMWFLYQLAPESPAYNVTFAVRIRSKVDVPALKRALQRLIDRHPSLRTTFAMRAGEPLQEVHDLQELSFEETDASTWSEDELDKQVVAAHRHPFDLALGPVLRVNLFTKTESEHIFLLTTHHIVFDGWSKWLLVDELQTLYLAETGNTSASLPALSLQYRDYVRWQAEMLAGPEGERLWAYWQQQLGGELPELDLPTDRPRPTAQTFRGATQSFIINETQTLQLRELAKVEGATLYMTLLAAFQVLLHRYSGQDDILVGSPVVGRSRAEFSGIVGDFINMIVLRADLGNNPTFKAFLDQVRQTVLDALAHQDYPLSLLVERLASKRNTGRSPLYQVSFMLQQPRRYVELAEHPIPGQDGSRINFGGLELEAYHVTQQEGQLDLTLEIVEVRGTLFGSLRYNTDLFDAATMSRMRGHFETLLEGIIANPDQRLSDLPLLTETERNQLLVEWNDTQAEYPQNQCIHSLFEAQVERTPDAIAVVFENEQITYRELNRRANQLAHHLRTLGIGPELLVGIYVERSVEMVVGLLGILKAGGAYVPLDPSFPQERLAFMLADSQASVLLSQQRLVEGLSGHRLQVVCLDTAWEAISRESTENPVDGAQSAHLAYVIYTSGSTGKPKGVQITHQAAVNFLNSMRKQPGLTEQDVLLAVTTISFDISLLELFLPISVGAQVEIVSSEVAADGSQLMKKLADARATVMQATPVTWRLLLEAGWQGSKQLKILCGGEALPRDLADRLLTRCSSLWNMYGPTETTVWSSLHQLDSGEATISIGRPIDNTQIYILDSHLQPVPIGVPGEMYIGGDGLSPGYLNRPELTAEKFIRHPFSDEVDARIYNTGDLARYLPDGRLVCLGRTDHQVKIRGFRIELGEIEAVLSQHPAIRENVVIVREDAPGDKRLVAYLVPSQEPVPSSSDLRGFLKEKLPNYMVPSAYVALDALPLTPNGKVDRRALPEPEGLRPELETAYVAPRNEIEQTLADIWQELLAVVQIGIHDDFFEMGGHSLLATQVMSRVRQTFQLELPLRDFFEAPNIAELAIVIEEGLIAEVEALTEDQAQRLAEGIG
jgi:amino acid adenylation domain-containing protein